MHIKNRTELSKTVLHGFIVDLIDYVLYIADPYRAIMDSVRVLDSKRVSIKNQVIEIDGRVHVVGFGKASKRMAKAIVEILGDMIAGGVVITPNSEDKIGSIEIVKGDHPVPRENTLRSSQKLVDYLTNSVSTKDTVIVLISGGGSALFEIPEDGISLNDIALISRELMRRGANIIELNAVRKRLSKVKGGKLLRFIKAKNVASLIVSDVIGDRLDTIASGPTAPDNTTFNEAYRVLVKYKIWNDLADNVKDIFVKGLAGEIPDTPKLTNPVFDKVVNSIIMSNSSVVEALTKRVEILGFKPLVLTTVLEGEAREVGRVLASIVKSIHLYGKPLSRPVAIITGGETSVTVRGSGVGGRNQELCLSLAIGIRDIPNTVAACFATDGVDGVSPAAGAIIDGDTVSEAYSLGLDPHEFLDNNDSYTFFNKLGRAIITGYTGTNVNDIFVTLMR